MNTNILLFDEFFLEWFLKKTVYFVFSFGTLGFMLSIKILEKTLNFFLAQIRKSINLIHIDDLKSE